MNGHLKAFALLLAVQTLCVAVVYADEAADKAREERWARQERIWKLEQRIREITPRRRDSPPRRENISDDEIREIENLTHEIFPRTLVNIGTVVTGCPCEDGPKCSDQVWLTAVKDNTTYELQLSRINNKWMVGPVQLWWIEYKNMQMEYERYWGKKFYPGGGTHESLVERFPICEQKPRHRIAEKN